MPLIIMRVATLRVREITYFKLNVWSFSFQYVIVSIIIKSKTEVLPFAN